VVIQPSATGLERRWYVNDTAKPWDAGAREWFQRTLLVLYRRAGVNAEARATRIFERGGADALLAEIAHIPTDYTASEYYAVLLTRATLPSATVRRLVVDAAGRIRSGYALGTILLATAEHQSLDEATALAMVAASDSISSDYTHGKVLEALVSTDAVDQRVADAVFASARRIGSDYTRAKVLTSYAAQYPAAKALPPAYLAAVRGIDSDYEKGQVLLALLRRDHVGPSAVAQVDTLAAAIGSDHTRSEVLLVRLRQQPLDGQTRAAFFRAAEGLHSDYELGRVLKAVAASKPDSATVATALAAVGRVGSDYAAADVLVAFAKRALVSAGLRTTYIHAAQRIGSRYSRNRALAAIAAAEE
jgi:hypothetical protein